VWAIFDMPAAPSYSSGLATLLGDAAHASTSHGGAGAGMAVEDALILSDLLSQAEIKDGRDITAAFKAYDFSRRPRTQKLVKYSRESGLTFSLRMPGIEDDVQKLKANLDIRQRWIWDINFEEHIQEARKILKQVMGSVV
jgi:salicylate hydroxylase